MKQKFSKMLAVLLAVMIVFTMMPTMAFAESSAVQISSAGDLPAEIPAGATYELTADIVLESGQQIETLAGVLDGKGHTITIADKPLASNVSGTIQNLGVLRISTVSVSGVSGSMAVTLTGTIQNCWSTVNLTSSGWDDVGGLVGKLSGGKIYNCYFAGSNSAMFADGLVGEADANATGNEIANCCYTVGYSAVGMNGSKVTQTNVSKKAAGDLQQSSALQSLNTDIPDTGYIWTLPTDSSINGGYPILTVDTGETVVDKSLLEARINSTKQLIETDYTVATWSAVKTALEAAETVYNDENATQSDVNSALGSLETTVNALEKKKPLEPVAVPEGATPIEISSVSDLDAIGAGTRKYYVLTKDITISSGDWYMPFYDFEGVFDGNGHTVTFDGQRYSGLFKNIGTNGVVQNVHFAGNIALEHGACADDVKGAVINCYSEVSGDYASGFALRIDDGVLSNCYSTSTAGNGVIIKQVTTQNGVNYYGTLNHVYWMNGLENTEVLQSSNLTSVDSTGYYADFMQSMDFVDLLNANRGENGTKWGQNSDGFPYFGENKEFTSGGTELPENKATVVFTPEGGSAAVVENQELTIDKNSLNQTGYAGEFSLKDYTVPDGASIEWGAKDQLPAGTAMVGASGGLSINKEGSLIVTATLVKADSTTELLASVKVTTYVSKIEDIELYVTDDNDTDNSEAVKAGSDPVQIAGSADTRIVVKAKYSGESTYRAIDASAFNFVIEAEDGVVEQMSGSNVFSFIQPGKQATVTVTNKQDVTISKTFTATSTYVAIETITPGISGTQTIHHRNSNMDESEFLYIKGSVSTSPSNASFAGDYTVTSSNPEIATYRASSGEFVPLKAGTVTFTAAVDDNGTTKTGSSTVTFVYANPLKNVSIANDSLTVKKNASVSAGLTFEGINDAYADVSEAGMSWTFDKEGIISISRESGSWKQGTGEINTGYFCSNEYVIYGLEEGTVTVTGTPTDTTGGAQPITFTVTVTAGDAEVAADNDKIIAEGITLAQNYLQKQNADRDFAYGDEWLVFILERSGSSIDPDKLAKYIESVEASYAAPTSTELKPTTLARVILTLEAIGEDATDVSGANLVEKLYNSTQITDGGNEAMWALIALDAKDFAVADGAKWSRTALIEEILAYQSADGGFSWASKTGSSDVDTTAMAIQALAPYNTAEYPTVQTAISKALGYLQEQMNIKCQYSTGSESAAQVLIALAALDYDALDEEKGFVKSVARNLITGIDEYKIENKGFKHSISDTSENAYATLQVLQGFEAYRRFAAEESYLYDLSDVSAANALAKRIAEAETLEESYYHEDLWAKLETALAAAKNVAANTDATEEQIREADEALASAIAALRESNPTPGIAADDITAYVTIAVKGNLAEAMDGTLVADGKVTVTDRNSDGKHTVDEVLYAAHEKYYPDGAAAGYGSAYGAYGLSITKLWGDTSGAYGYWYNNGSCWSLDDVVSDNAYVTAFVYKDTTAWNDSYSYFDKETYSVSMNSDMEVTLTYAAGYDADWNRVFSPYEGAKIQVIGDSAVKATTGADGKATLTFDKAGIYKIVATSEDGLLVPSVATITVVDPSVPKEQVYLRVANPSGKTYLAKTSYDFEQGATALSVLLNSGLDVETRYYAVYGSHYVVSIEGLGEFDGGAQSGWMYKVNGTAPDYGASSYVLKAGDYVEWLYTKDLGADIGVKPTESEVITQTVAGADGTKEMATTVPADVMVSGTIARATISDTNTTEMLKQAKENQSAEIIIDAVTSADSSVKNTVKTELTLAKSTVKSIASDTPAALTVKTQQGSMTISAETLDEIAANAKGSLVTLEVAQETTESSETVTVITVKSSGETLYTAQREVTVSETLDAEGVKALLADLTPVARSVKAANKNVKVTVKLDAADKAIIEQIEDAGYTVKYNYYRSAKKSSKYSSMLMKEGKTYINTIGKKNTMYYYKVRVQVYDQDGKLVGRTALKQCRYANRLWTKK